MDCMAKKPRTEEVVSEVDSKVSAAGGHEAELPLTLLLGSAARLASALKERLGRRMRIEILGLEELNNEASEALLAQAVGLVAQPMPEVNSLVHRMPRLSIVQSVATGIEVWDLASMPPKVAVCNCSTMDHAIAEYVLSAMLHWQVRLLELDRQFKEVKTFLPPFRYPGYKGGCAEVQSELGGKTVCLVGFGSIGLQVAIRARALHMRVVAVRSRPCDSTPPELDFLGTTADLKGLLRQSHFVVLCCGLNECTRGLLNAEALACMSPEGVLINVARGAVVDEDAIYEALCNRRIKGATLDVWWQYPNPEAPEVMPSRHPFHELDNVVMTPHASGWTAESETRKVEQVAHNLVQCMHENPMYNFVRKPAISSAGL
mmetsp:Transcript_79117/g.219881  ORF Transcript_79117/g.219881 Transcript_79117/m.219881 type:complete len:374 (-) Transcript_79117:268-1389(-)